jgi:putative transposase
MLRQRVISAAFEGRNWECKLMAKKKRHNAVEIEAKLREADALSAAGWTQSEISKGLGVSVMTLHRWRKATPKQSQLVSATVSSHLEAPIVDAPGRLARITELQLENTRLRRLVTDLLLEKMRLEDEQQRLGGRTAKTA